MIGSLTSWAAESKSEKNLPARSISVFPEYTGVMTEQGEGVSIDVKVKNGGRKGESIDLQVKTTPEGWDAWFKTYSYGVTGVYVDSDSTKSLTLRAEPDDSVSPGSYTFPIQGRTQDGKLTSSAEVTVNVKAKEEAKKIKGVDILTSYPVLQGPTDAEFEFSLEVENKLDKDTIFNLMAEGPKDWDINFKPAYEEKFISSLRSKKGQSQTVAVEVKPYALAEPGEYPIRVKVSSPDAKGEAELKVILTGTYKLDLGTAEGLLSLEAVKGKDANLSIYVKNSGSATLNNLKFMSVKPENWKVEFNPDTVETLNPGELKQIEVTITPAEEALVGDYSVILRAEAGKISKPIELRVTARASAAWAWIGIGIILLVVAGLVILFIRLGRR
jgi:uncharacterized membrane protein